MKPTHFSLHTTETAQWHALVSEAEAAAGCALKEDTESYLVFMLMRFLRKARLAKDSLALVYLQALQKRGALREQALREVGDQCLLYAGLFPEQAQRRCVPVSYYVDLGRSAYLLLWSERSNELFYQLSLAFVEMMDVLLNVREIDRRGRALQPLQAHELWVHTGSRHALRIVQEAVGGMPIAAASRQVH